MSIKDILRKKALKQCGNKTYILPLSGIKTAVVFLDVSEQEDCEAPVREFFRENNIKGEIIFFDFKKKSEFNFYGKPSDGQLAALDAVEPDLMISLLGNSYSAEYLAAYCKAKFKVGRIQMFGDIFDLVVSEPSEQSLSAAESFQAIKSIIYKIR